MVFAMLLVATVVVGYVGVGRQRVQEQEVVGLLGRVVVGLGEEKFVGQAAIDEDAAQTWRIIVARRVVFAIETRVVDGVLIEMRHRVKFGWLYVTKQPVDLPSPYALWKLFVAFHGVALVGIEV